MEWRGRFIYGIVILLVLQDAYAGGSLWGNDFVISVGTLCRNVGSDSIYLFILPSKPTQCRIYYRTCTDGQTYRVQYVLAESRRSMRIGIPRSHFEQPYGQNACGTIVLSSDDPVLVLAFINDSVGGEAAAVMPTRMLGRTYVVPAILPGIYRKNEESSPPRTSLFAAIVAPQATLVTLSSATHLIRINGSHVRGEQRLLLEAGEQCLIEYEPSDSMDNQPAIVIQASNPIAVFWGGRDGQSLLYEQLIAAEYWDVEYILPKFPQPAAYEQAGSGSALVTAVSDSTWISGDGIAPFILNAGESRLLFLNGPAQIISSQPIGMMMVGQYVIEDAAGGYVFVLPPAAGRIGRINLISPQLRNGVFRLYTEQYVCLVTDGGGASLVFDGAPWSGTWETVPSGVYNVGTRRVGDDVHIVEAGRERILSWIIGYGDRRSYATCGDFQVSAYPYLHARLRITNDTVSTQDTFSIQIVLSQLSLPPPLLRIANPTRVRLRLRWNATVATPLQSDLQGSIRDGYHYQWLDIPAPPSGFHNGDTLASLTLLAALGELPAFRIEIDSIYWLDHSGHVIISRYEQEGGSIIFSDIWQDQWGKRLVSPNGGGFNLSVVPNPVQESAVIVLGLSRDLQLPTLELFNAMGERVRAFQLSSAEVASGQVLLQRGTLPSGIYFLRVAIGMRSFVVPVVFQ